MESMDYMLHLLVTSIAGDYIDTHPHRAGEVDANLRAIVDHCAASLDQGDEDVPRHDWGGMPGIVRAAQQCADAFDSIRRDDVDVLPPALYVAMRELARELRGAHTLFVHIAPSADAITTRDLASDIVEATRRFVAVYEDFESDLALTNYDRSMLTGMGIMARQRVLSE